MSPGMQVWGVRPGLSSSVTGKQKPKGRCSLSFSSSNLSHLTCHLRSYILPIPPTPHFLFSPLQADSPAWTLKPIAPNPTFPQMSLSPTWSHHLGLHWVFLHPLIKALLSSKKENDKSPLTLYPLLAVALHQPLFSAEPSTLAVSLQFFPKPMWSGSALHSKVTTSPLGNRWIFFTPQPPTQLPLPFEKLSSLGSMEIYTRDSPPAFWATPECALHVSTPTPLL